jgi:translocation and assembly module TamB
MRGFLSGFLGLVFWMLCTFAAVAQDEDKGFLTRTIQDALSGSGRVVSIAGFQGALSSTASFDQMTIADGQGVWLTLRDVELVWNRSALLRGRLEVERLTAASLDVPRAPVAEGELPDAEAAPFSLPDLPVSILIEAFAVDKITLGAPLLGEAAELSVQANARYTEDVLDVVFKANRTDGKAGVFEVSANFERSDTILDLMIQLTEGEAGLASRLLDLPGKPSVELAVSGSGPLDDFTADVALATVGIDRIAGQISLGAQTPRRASDTPDRRVLADIGGDITALLAPQYREFFGQDVRLNVDALFESNGAVDLTSFALKSQAAQLQGKVTLNADKWPTFIDVNGLIANVDNTRVLLPTSGDAITLDRVDLTINYDATDGDAFAGTFDISALQTGAAAIERTMLGLEGTLQANVGAVGQFKGGLIFDARGLALNDQAFAEAVGDVIQGRTQLTFVEGQPVEFTDLVVSGADYALTSDVTIESFETGFSTLIDAALEARDLSRFSALAGRELDGQAELAVQGRVTPLSGQFDISAKGTTQDLRLGIDQADAVLAGLTQLNFAAKRDETGTFLRDLQLSNAGIALTGDAQLRSDNSQVRLAADLADIALVAPQYDGPVSIDAVATQDAQGWSIDAVTDGPYAAALTAKGRATGPTARLVFTADVPNVGPFAPGVKGAVVAQGVVQQTSQGWQVETELTGPYRIEAALNGMLTPMLDLNFDVALPNIQPLAPQINGPLSARGNLRQTDKGFVIDTSANGPYGSKAEVEGLATGPDMRLAFDVSLPNIRPFAPGINGPLQAQGVLRQTPQGIAVQTNAQGPYAARASVDGVVTGPQAAVSFDVSMPNIGALVDKVNGPLSVRGTALKQANAWRLETNAQGPAGTQAQLSGVVNENGRLNLGLTGTAPLGLSRPFIAPRNLQGQARFDLAINGPAALSSVTGTIQTSDATLSAPNLRIALEKIAANIQLARNRANVDLKANAVNGGQLRVGGGITLTSSLPADLEIALSELVLIDPRLYRTSVDGTLRLAGPLTGGAQIAGGLSVGETTVNVPSTGLTSIGEIPQITHVGERAGVAATRSKAGLTGTEAGVGSTASAGAGFGLNLTVDAPRRIFVRGRGLDAELGGSLRLTGTTKRVISAGRFDLLRGRLDILGKRFDLVEGSVQFQGDLVPYLRFVSTTTTTTGDVSVTVEGPADAPEVTFASNPAAPQDEVLAQLLFGRNLSEISAFQALQLANAVATLAGRGGTGIISNLRDGFGLDDLDVTTTDSGATALRVGKYLSDNVYTDVTAASDGTGEVSLNIDITPNLKGKATLGSDGNSGIGLFFEMDD